jgi:16S rRNA G966 N2-methylase RsmD
MCDFSKAAADVIRSNAIKTRLAPMCEIVTMDWEVLLRSQKNKRKFGLVFIDPPYAMGVVPKVLETLLQDELLEEDAKLVCETAEESDVFRENAGLQEAFDVVRKARYGAAAVTILTPRQKGENV